MSTGRQPSTPETSALSARNLAAWRSVREAGNAVTARIADELEQRSGVPLDWYGILLHVFEDGVDGRLPQNALDRHLALSQSGISRVVSKMTNAGLVTREPIPHDRRNVYVVLTERGRDVFVRATPVHNAAIERHFGKYLTATEAAKINSGLRKVVTADDGGRVRRDGSFDQVVAFGQSVLSVTSDSVAVTDAILVRDAIEPLLLADAARNLTSGAIEELRSIVTVMSASLASPEAFFRADWDLHRVLAGHCRNDLLRATYLSLLDVVTSHLDSVVPTESLNDYLQQRLSIHARLVDALASGDPQRIGDAAREHTFTGTDRLI